MAAPGTPSVGSAAFGASGAFNLAAPASAGVRQYAIVTLTVSTETVTPPAGWTLRRSLALTTPNSNIPDRGNTQYVAIYEQDVPDTAAAAFTKSGTRRFAAIRISWPGVIGTPVFATPTQSSNATTHTAPSSTPPANTDTKVVAVAIIDQGPTPVTLTSPGSPWTSVVASDLPTPVGSETQSIRVIEQTIPATPSPSPVSASFTTSAVEEAFLISFVLPGDVAAEPTTLRLYMANKNADRPPVAGALPMWSGANLTAPQALTNEPTGAAAFIQLAETSAAAPYYVMISRWVSGPALTAGTLAAADCTFTMGRMESAADADFSWAAAAWVMAPDGSLKATAFQVWATAEWPVGATPTESVAGALTVLADDITAADIDAGDRVVLELGYRSANVLTASRTGTLVCGGTATPDLAPSDTGANLSRPSWVDLPVFEGLAFADPEPDTGALSGTSGVPAAALTGAASVSGTLGGTLTAPAAAAAGDVVAVGSVGGTATAPQASLAGTASATGVLTGTTPAPTITATAAVAAAGSITAIAPVPAVALAGGATATGALAATAPAPTADMTATLTTAGLLAAAAPTAIVEIGGDGAARGTLEASTPELDAAIAGAVATTGDLAAAIAGPVAELTGTATTVGQLSGASLAPGVSLIASGASSGALTSTLAGPTVELLGAVAGPGTFLATVAAPDVDLETAATVAGLLAAAAAAPIAELVGVTGNQDALLNVVVPAPAAALQGEMALAGALAAATPAVTGSFSDAPPVTYVTPLRAGSLSWAVPRLRAGVPEWISGLVAGQPTRD